MHKLIILILLLIPLIESFANEGKIKESIKKIEGFTFLQENTYSARGQTNIVKEYRHEKTGIEFVLVPGGSFMMGSNDEDSDEKPVHRVRVSEFLISKYEVTQGQWKKVMKTSPWSGKEYVKEGGDYAASYVSWNDAKEFCRKIGLRLPSEAEWEYSCRAGTTTKYYSGNNINGDYAWYNVNAWDVGEKYAHEVEKKRPNAFGLYDMSGNVCEWCEDKWHDNYSGALVNGSAWIDNGGSERVFRGGGWSYAASYLRSACRGRFSPDYRFSSLGFRVSFSP